MLVGRAGATLHCGAWVSHCGGFSCCGVRASVVVARELSSCGTWAQLLCGMWNLPGPELEPVSPALAGGFLTTAPPGKSLHVGLKPQHFMCFFGSAWFFITSPSIKFTLNLYAVCSPEKI